MFPQHIWLRLTNNFNIGSGRSCQRRPSLHCSQQPSLSVSLSMAMHTFRYRGIVASLWPLYWVLVTPVWRPSSLYLLVIGCLSTVIAGINCIIILSDGGGSSGLRKWIVNDMHHSTDLHSLSGSPFTNTLQTLELELYDIVMRYFNVSYMWLLFLHTLLEQFHSTTEAVSHGLRHNLETEHIESWNWNMIIDDLIISIK